MRSSSSNAKTQDPSEGQNEMQQENWGKPRIFRRFNKATIIT